MTALMIAGAEPKALKGGKPESVLKAISPMYNVNRDKLTSDIVIANA